MANVATTPLLTKEQACSFLGISVSTLHRMTQAGKVTPLKIGKAVRFSKESLIAANSFVSPEKHAV